MKTETSNIIMEWLEPMCLRMQVHGFYLIQMTIPDRPNSRNDGYTVCKAYNGFEALKCIESGNVDLAILDVMLPDMDGFRI